jgi:hypothetical protein
MSWTWFWISARNSGPLKYQDGYARIEGCQDSTLLDGQPEALRVGGWLVPCKAAAGKGNGVPQGDIVLPETVF